MVVLNNSKNAEITPIQFLSKNAALARLVREYIDAKEQAPDNVVCSCCKMTSESWSPTNEGIKSEEYSKPVWHCTSCHILFHGSLTKLGIEGRKTVPFKLGMLPGCGLFVTKEECYLFAPGKYFPKFQAVSDSVFTAIFDLGGASATLKMIELWIANKQEDTLIISDLGKKKSDLVNNLRLSNKTTLNLCSQDACLPLLEPEISFMAAMVGIDKKPRQKLLKAIKASCQGSMPIKDALEMNAMIAEYNLQSAFQQLNQDPHLRLALLRIIGGAD